MWGRRGPKHLPVVTMVTGVRWRDVSVRHTGTLTAHGDTARTLPMRVRAGHRCAWGGLMSSAPSDEVVIAGGVARQFGEGDTAVHALRGIDVHVPSGELTAVMGPSGSGKSTLMHILAGLDKPTSGSVHIAGTEITTLDDTDLTKLRRRHIGFIFQFFNLLPMLTARENVMLPLTIAGTKPDPGWFDDLIERIGLTDRLAHRPAELSGGQQQRVAIARALVSRPSVVFADEPTGNLDSTTSGEILTLMRSSVDEYGQTTVMVTHDAHAAAMADRVLFLADGQIVQELPRSSQHDILLAIEKLDAR
jgi:putative ABC transport system ATP-binding protein